MGEARIMPNYYWLETGGLWDESVVLSSVAWVAQDTYKTVLPASMTFKVGIDPNVASFIVKADVTAVHHATFPPVATVQVASQRRPNLTDAEMSLPSILASGGGAEGLKPFTIIRIRSAATSAKTSPTTRFVGLVLRMSMDLSSEEWIVEALDIARYYMSKIGIKKYISQDGDPDEVRQQDDLAIYNEDGKPDHLVLSDGTRTCYFTTPNLNSKEGVQKDVTKIYADYWRIGDILNSLRDMFIVNSATYGLPDMSELLTWPECSDVPGLEQWPFLLTSYSTNLADLAIGGTNLREAIDTIVRKAGDYEWEPVWDDDVEKWSLSIFSKYTGDPLQETPTVDMQRGLLGDGSYWVDPDVPTDIAAGKITFDWEKCATKSVVVGKKDIQEVTIGYGTGKATDIAAGTDGAFREILEPDWTDTEMASYRAKKLTNSPEAEGCYSNVGQKFKFKDSCVWKEILGLPDNNTQRSGPKKLLQILVSKNVDLTTDGSTRHLKARIFRLRNDTWEEAPNTVSLQINQDYSISIKGVSPLDDPIQYTAMDKYFYPRWIIDTSVSPWVSWPIRITACVERDERLTVEEDTDSPAEWPVTEELLTGVDFRVLRREKTPASASVLHGVISHVPTENDYASVEYVTDNDDLYIEGDTILSGLSTKLRKCVQHPVVVGEIISDEHDFNIQPGIILNDLVGGTIDTGGPEIPLIHIYSMIQEVEYIGLSAEATGQTRMLVKL